METSREFPPLSLVKKKKCSHLHVRRRNLREAFLKCTLTWPTLGKLKRSIQPQTRKKREDSWEIWEIWCKWNRPCEEGKRVWVGFSWFMWRKKKAKNLFFKTIGILKWPHHVQRSLSESHCCTRVHVSSPPSLRESKVLILFHARRSAKVSRQEYFKQHFTRHEPIRRLNFKSLHFCARFQGNL